MVAKLVDGYLAKIARDHELPVSKFVELADVVSGISRPGHDGLYRTIDMYLKEHPGISKNERKKIYNLMNCKKLSVEACMHAVENERLPLRVIVQVLFFEQVGASATSGTSTPDLPHSIRDLQSGSRRSSKRLTPPNADEDWDAVASAEELKSLRTELAALKLENGREGRDLHKIKGSLLITKMFTKLWSSKSRNIGEMSGSDSSESHSSSANHDDVNSTPSMNRRV